MSLPVFPSRHLDEEDPQYQGRFRHTVVLQPSRHGATIAEIARFAQDLKSGIEFTTLSDTAEIPHSSLGGKGLTIQSLKREVSDIIGRNPAEWIRGCVGITVMHNPDKRTELVSALSKLPDSINASDQKLLSVPHGDDLFSFTVRLHENRFVPGDGLFIWLDNPSEPAAEHVVPSHRGEMLNFSDLYAPKENMEYFAMGSLLYDLTTRAGITPEDLEPEHEPLGVAFPDFGLSIRGEEWAVEVTRIERDMVSYLRVSEPIDQAMLHRTTQKHVTDSRIADALTKALEAKSKIRNDCPSYSRACLLLVDVVDSVEVDDTSVWDGIDMSAFDVVALVKLDGSLSYIKGASVLQ